jgi:glycosyltransferase involved in cell wall biosynthesis
MRNISEFDKVLFIFTGHGSRKDEIESKLELNGVINVKFYDFLKGQDYKDVLNIADVCLVSLKKGIEGLGVPSKAYGYFAFGKPVISIMSEETELAKIIKSNNAGYNVTQNDIEGLIAAIKSLINEPCLIKEFSENSQKIYQSTYEKNISLAKYYDFIVRFF